MSLSSFLHTVKWFQILQYNSHNLTSVICLHTVCSIWPYQMQTLLVRIDLGVMAMLVVLHIPQNSKAGAAESNGSMLYPRHSLVGSYPSAEMQLVNFTPPANLAFHSYVVGIN